MREGRGLVNGVGRTMAAVLVAEIGNEIRSKSAAAASTAIVSGARTFAKWSLAFRVLRTFGEVVRTRLPRCCVGATI